MKINGKQCARARALLKWNLYDLASRTRILHSRLTNFEKGRIHIEQGENDELVKVLTKVGIEFQKNGEVLLIAMDGKQHSIHQASQAYAESAKVLINSEDLVKLAEDKDKEETKKKQSGDPRKKPNGETEEKKLPIPPSSAAGQPPAQKPK